MTEEPKKVKKKKTLKQRIPEILLILVFIIGLGIFLYPTVSDQWNRYRQSLLIATYTQSVSGMTEGQYDEAWAEAEAYNATITSNAFTGDIFENPVNGEEDQAYWSALNINGDGVMGYVSIPKINQEIPIYHGTSDQVLQKGCGHLDGTKLPIGGLGCHSVLSAHRGLPSAKLFTDIDKLTTGDKFYLHILDQTLAYEVDQVLPMVDKDDLITLSDAMQNVEGQDYVTLLTCTPYGVNSHRLLVRGHRVEYLGEDENTDTIPETMLKSVQNYYMLYLLLALAAAVLIVLLIRLIKRLKKRKSAKPKEEGL